MNIKRNPRYAPYNPNTQAYRGMVSASVRAVAAAAPTRPAAASSTVTGTSTYLTDADGNIVTVAPFLAGVDNWFDNDPATTTALAFGYTSGFIIQSTNTAVAVPAGTVALTASTINYVEVDNLGTVTAATVRDADNKSMWQVETDATSIIDMTDERVGFEF